MGYEVAQHEAAQHSSSAHAIALCVDDFGLHAGVNAAVLQLAALGRVQATSAMVGAPAWAEGALQLRALDAQRLEVGLHLDLTQYPFDSGQRWPLAQLIARSYLGQLDRSALAREIAAQFDAFEQALGRAPAYVDGHQHVHQLPLVRELLLAELARRYAPGLLWLRSTRSGAYGAHGDARTAFKSAVIAGLGSRALLAQAQQQGLRHNRCLLGVYDFTGGETGYQARLQRWLQAAQPGDLLMCHPGQPCAAPDGLAAAREAEWRVLVGDAFPALVAGAGLRLQPLGALLN